MPKFGKKSKKQLATLHPDLQEVLNEAIKHVDFTILEGHRPQEIQDKYYEEGKTKLKYPHGRHNKVPSLAVDIWKYPVNFSDTDNQTLLAGFILGIGQAMGINLIWGNDWDRDFDTSNTGFKDYPHIEISKK